MELELSEVDIAATAEAAVEGLQDRIKEARIRLERRIPADIGSFVADEKRVRQILFNLLANAVAFSPPGGRVVLAARRDGDVIAFTIADEGVGIARDFIGSVFDRFASQSRGTSRGGVGLGLSIVKSFVGLHGGTVAIESEVGQGSRITVRLPARPGVVAAAAE